MPDEYSADVEIDEAGRLVAVRALTLGEVVTVPFHMIGALRAPGLDLHPVECEMPNGYRLNLFRRGVAYKLYTPFEAQPPTIPDA